MAKKKIAIIGVGKIAIDQHLPVIDRSPDFEVAATVSNRMIRHRDLPVFHTPAEFYKAMPKVELVAICTPPSVRHHLVREAIDAGRHVLMEKPPTTTISELDDIVAYAKKKKRILFQTWHSRYNRCVDKAQKLIKREGVKSARIDWRESVRKWHPGQDWVWEPGGFGVFDPGINALSIFTKIIPFPVFVESSRLAFPSNKQSPVDVQLKFRSDQPHQPEMSAGFNWLEESGEIWTIRVETLAGKEIKLEGGGRTLRINGEIVDQHGDDEYAQIYAHFAKLLKKGRSDVSDAPLRLVADAFLIGGRDNVEPFAW